MAKAGKRGIHRKRRERTARCRACCCTSTAAATKWFQDERWYDLIPVILDDATSEIYYAQLVWKKNRRFR